MLAACGFLGFSSQVCMTIGMQNSKSATGSLMRQSGIVFAFAFQVMFVPEEGISLSTIVGALIITSAMIMLGVWKSREEEVSRVGRGLRVSRVGVWMGVWVMVRAMVE